MFLANKRIGRANLEATGIGKPIGNTAHQKVISSSRGFPDRPPKDRSAIAIAFVAL